MIAGGAAGSPKRTLTVAGRQAAGGARGPTAPRCPPPPAPHPRGLASALLLGPSRARTGSAAARDAQAADFFRARGATNRVMT